MAQDNSGMQNDDLLNAFRAQYQHFSMAIPRAIQSDVDPVSLARLGDNLDEYRNLAQEVRCASLQCFSRFEYLSFSMKLSFLQLSFQCLCKIWQS